MSFGFFRGIWISLRAVNYTSAAFQQVAKDLNMLQEVELKFLQRTQKLMQVGAIFLAMGGLVTMGIMNIIKSSEEGAAYMDMFGKSVKESMSKIGAQLFAIMKPLLDMSMALLKIISTTPQLRFMAAIFLIIAGPVLMLAGILIILNSLFKILASTVIMQAVLPALLKYIVGVDLAQIITIKWASCLTILTASAFGIFSILTALMPIIGRTGTMIAGIIAVVIGLAVAFLALHSAMAGPAAGAMFMTQLGMLGAGLAIGGALAAAYAATMPQIPEYQMGTSFVRRGGLAILHPAETVTSARETRMPSRMERGEAPSYKKSSFFIPISIGTIHTKADKETLVPTIKKVLKEELDQRV